MSPNLVASVRARLLNVAKAQASDFNQVLVRFALERILYRLTQSPHADRFLLKGALLFTLWYDMPHRATRDADLLGFGASDLESVAQVFREIAAVAVDDGIVFDPASVTVEEIRKEAGYGGVRVVIAGELAKARCKTQIDVGFGDAVTPGPVDSVYPVLLDDLPAPRLRAYPTYTVIAEKLHAIALLGMTNSRVKDYFDLSVLLEREILDADLLAQAIKATFERRGMTVPAELPVGLTDEFAHDASRQVLWQSFVKKNELDPEPLAAIVGRLRLALEPALNRAAR
ncbi:nucleotidyl transferase AbiEii/AbiGii toxin family protein [Pseudomonas aeruginosa]|uniref:nucleotidyl transferase AbiEii/AbiGii toxin family protein n=1 Tax=Pseudomonas aeruginosa TaxID=287 RepID=UPI00044FE92F|nr:nucleotidyl transferase AbiEii/AbiGii toxin family protein [Pseudomonas aeruginosa]MBN4982060.1 nucleotidyl transferase AbiEii/AbiGii toxin family protein [Stenotrophomonas maltophilia]EIU7198871.1 nucleotidyl transferase AbiEii/AbiGii toxin family protein [Pseudomonas aeruginosa]ELH4131478.1 nucleotidyl transferase AbiEii/AbiGii toxin family protein [Pseudomonas aeruginosa]ELQ8269583.1 nucleotidyl transferase AbiEii/AbiGii toxin family protein [Pseudomonas aeruginosa]EZO89714.1 hypothetica